MLTLVIAERKRRLRCSCRRSKKSATTFGEVTNNTSNDEVINNWSELADCYDEISRKIKNYNQIRLQRVLNQWQTIFM